MAYQGIKREGFNPAERLQTETIQCLAHSVNFRPKNIYQALKSCAISRDYIEEDSIPPKDY